MKKKNGATFETVMVINSARKKKRDDLIILHNSFFFLFLLKAARNLTYPDPDYIATFVLHMYLYKAINVVMGSWRGETLSDRGEIWKIYNQLVEY